MEYEDRLTHTTPEGVALSLTLANVGSRCAAAIVDLTIQLVLVIALAAGLAPLGAALHSDYAAVAAWTVGGFLVLFGYDIAWEVWGGGRTPGKRLVGLRVVRTSGAAIGFRASAVRNLMRLVDAVPGMYGIGLVAVLATPRNQRLGDLAADSVVVHDRRRPRQSRQDASAPAPPALSPAQPLDVTAVNSRELALVRSFLERRGQLRPDARAQLAAQLAARLRPKVGGAPPDSEPEAFLAMVAEVKSRRA